jgi:hypothetical protein
MVCSTPSPTVGPGKIEPKICSLLLLTYFQCSVPKASLCQSKIIYIAGNSKRFQCMTFAIRSKSLRASIKPIERAVALHLGPILCSGPNRVTRLAEFSHFGQLFTVHRQVFFNYRSRPNFRAAFLPR